MQSEVKELNFEGQNIYVGIDVHLKSWAVSIFTERLYHKTFSQPPEAEKLKSYLDKNFPNGTYYSVYEAGFCGFWIHNELMRMGVNNIVVNPADVPTSQKEQLQKDDPTDSRKLGRALRSGDLTALYVPSVSTLEERALVRLRSTLVRDMTRFKQRIKSFLYFNGIPYPAEFARTSTHWTRRFINWLKNDIALRSPAGATTLMFLVKEAEQQRALLLEITSHMRQMAQTEKYLSDMGFLQSIPGIGFITAISCLTEIEDIRRFKNTDHLSGFIGLVPSRHSSGEKDKNGEMTFRGQDFLKNALIESSWIAARLDPALHLAYSNYVKRMDPNKAIIRIARKLLNRIYFVLTKKQTYVKGVVQ